MTRHISRDEFLKLTKKPTASKYRAKKSVIDGFTFDSQAEARFYQELKLRSRGGIGAKVRNIVCHPGWDLGSCYYKADFAFDEWREDPGGLSQFDDWHPVVVDVKGVLTRDCKIKLRLMREKYGIEVRLLTKDSDPRLFRSSK